MDTERGECLQNIKVNWGSPRQVSHDKRSMRDVSSTYFLDGIKRPRGGVLFVQGTSVKPPQMLPFSPCKRWTVKLQCCGLPPSSTMTRQRGRVSCCHSHLSDDVGGCDAIATAVEVVSSEAVAFGAKHTRPLLLAVTKPEAKRQWPLAQQLCSRKSPSMVPF